MPWPQESSACGLQTIEATLRPLSLCKVCLGSSSCGQTKLSRSISPACFNPSVVWALSIQVVFASSTFWSGSSSRVFSYHHGWLASLSWLSLLWLCQGQEERRKCPKCGALSRHAGDYVDLRSYDDPRSSLPADTASIYTTSDAPVARHYRWVCRPEESEAPFTENSELDAAEARWAKFPDHGTNLVTRYWGFLQNGLRVSAVVSDS